MKPQCTTAAQCLVDRFREVISYNPETGEAKWKETVNRNSAKAGDPVGTITAKGYLRFRLDRTNHYLHRAVWAIHYGEFPDETIDHINRVKTDNRIENLRNIPAHINAKNKGINRNNKSGYSGISLMSNGKKWKSEIRWNSKTIYLGLFSDINDAVSARNAALESLRQSTERE